MASAPTPKKWPISADHIPVGTVVMVIRGPHRGLRAAVLRNNGRAVQLEVYVDPLRGVTVEAWAKRISVSTEWAPRAGVA